MRPLKGQLELMKFELGELLTDSQKIAAKCYDCSSGYDMGLGCRVADCPLVSYNPYNMKKGAPSGINPQMKTLLPWAQGLARKRGKTELIKFLKDEERLKRRQAIAATCIRCTSGYYEEDGCDNDECPLFNSNPYVLTGENRLLEEEEVSG